MKKEDIYVNSPNYNFRQGKYDIQLDIIIRFMIKKNKHKDALKPKQKKYFLCGISIQKHQYQTYEHLLHENKDIVRSL